MSWWDKPAPPGGKTLRDLRVRDYLDALITLWWGTVGWLFHDEDFD